MTASSLLVSLLWRGVFAFGFRSSWNYFVAYMITIPTRRHFLIKTKFSINYIFHSFRTLFSWRGKIGKKFCAVVQLFWNIHFFHFSPFFSLPLGVYKKYPQMTLIVWHFWFFFRCLNSQAVLLLLACHIDFTRFPIFSLSRFFSFQIHQCQWRTIAFFFLGSLF